MNKDIDIGKEMRSLSHMIMRYIENSPLHKEIVSSLTGTNGFIIGYLSDHMGEDVYQKDLEKEFSITRSTASKVIGLMVEKGFIEKLPVEHDARLKKLVLTKKALDVSEMMKANRERVKKALVKGFTDEEIELLDSYFERMKKNIGE